MPCLSADGRGRLQKEPGNVGESRELWGMHSGSWQGGISVGGRTDFAKSITVRVRPRSSSCVPHRRVPEDPATWPLAPPPKSPIHSLWGGALRLASQTSFRRWSCGLSRAPPHLEKHTQQPLSRLCTAASGQRWRKQSQGGLFTVLYFPRELRSKAVTSE